MVELARIYPCERLAEISDDQKFMTLDIWYVSYIAFLL
jgi:hypothetical protein